MLTVLSHNPDKTVGLCEGDNPKSFYIGAFNPLLLKEWIDLVLETYGPDNIIFLSQHPSAECTGVALCAASEYCDSLQVVVTGLDNNE